MKRWLSIDPSRTKTLRMKFMRETRRRLRALERAIWSFLVVEDAFGLEKKQPFQFNQSPLANRRQYEFLSNPKKVEQFRSWLQQQIDAKVLEVNVRPGQKPWVAQYVESAWQKGMMRSYTEMRPDIMAETPAWYRGSREQFVRSAFNQPLMMSKIEMVGARAFESMKGITDTISTQLSRILMDGMIAGRGPVAVARDMQRSIAGMSRSRAMTIARTEIIHAHAEGQLDGFEMLGVKEVMAQVEWLTAGDDRVCPSCEDLEGQTFSIQEAHGMIPLHPNCRCAWMPVA